jgi:hypothetical protein
MGRNSSLISQIVLLMFTIIVSDTTAGLSINERLNLESHGITATTANNISNSNNYSSGDPYIDEVYEECIRDKDISTCAKFRVLRYFHEMIPKVDEPGRNSTAGGREFALWGPIKLVPLPLTEAQRNGGTFFPALKQDPTDSEFMKLLRFSLREVERFLKTYGLLVDVSVAESSGGSEGEVESPRVIDDIFSGDLRGKITDTRKLLMLLTNCRQDLDFLYVAQCGLVEVYWC